MSYLDTFGWRIKWQVSAMHTLQCVGHQYFFFFAQTFVICFVILLYTEANTFATKRLVSVNTTVSSYFIVMRCWMPLKVIQGQGTHQIWCIVFWCCIESKFVIFLVDVLCCKILFGNVLLDDETGQIGKKIANSRAMICNTSYIS